MCSRWCCWCATLHPTSWSFGYVTSIWKVVWTQFARVGHLNFTTENWIEEKFRQITCRTFPLPTINTFISHKFNSMHPLESWENCIHCWESQTLSILYTFPLTIAKPWEEIIPITIITIYWVLWGNWIVGNHWSLPIFSLGDLNVQPDKVMGANS